MSNGLPTPSGYTELGDLLRQAGRSALSSEQPKEQEFAGFKLVKLIGVGGMGASVYLAQSSTDPPEVAAIKVLPNTFALDDHLARRFRREAKVMQKIDHPNTVRMLEFGTVDTGQHFILMEYLGGGSLAELLATDRHLDADRAIKIATDVSAGLAALHDARITHRDIKPGNILLAEDGTSKLADFGLAKFLDPTSVAGALTRTGDHLGTTAYMAPEQLAGTSSGDHQSDLYSLGVVLYQMLTGIVPHGRVNAPSIVRPELARYDEVVMRAIDADPARRFQNATEFGQALSKAHRITPRKRLSRRAALIGLGGIAGITWISLPRPPAANLAWDDLSNAQQTLGNTTEFVVGLPSREATLRFRLLLGASGYEVEPLDVPATFLKPVSLSEVLSLPGLPSLLARLSVKSLIVSIPESVRLDSDFRKTVANIPAADAEASHFSKACRWIDRIERAGILRRSAGSLSIDTQQCSDYGMFCKALGIPPLSVSEALDESASQDATYRVACFQLLRQSGTQRYPSLSEANDFGIESIEMRSPLEIVAALVAEPWLLPRRPGLPWRPLYNGERKQKDSLNKPTVTAVEALLENLS